MRDYFRIREQSSGLHAMPAGTFEHKKPGRPRKAGETKKLVFKLAEENIWGYRRIAGEMKKLGHELCSGTVRNILIKNGLPPAPKERIYPGNVSSSPLWMWPGPWIFSPKRFGPRAH